MLSNSTKYCNCYGSVECVCVYNEQWNQSTKWNNTGLVCLMNEWGVMISCTNNNLGLGTHPLHLLLSKPAATGTTRFPFLRLRVQFHGIALPSKPTSQFNAFNAKDGNFVGQQEEGQGEGEREVQCEVGVISWRARRINAQISVNADTESVWNALTDYDHLADFIPNLLWR